MWNTWKLAFKLSVYPRLIKYDDDDDDYDDDDNDDDDDISCFSFPEQVQKEQAEMQEQVNLSVRFYTERISMFLYYRVRGRTL